MNGIQFDCSLDFGDVFVAAGDTVLLTSAGVVENVLRTTVNTETFLNASVYEIVGRSDVRAVPEPSTGLLAGLAGLIGWWSAARRRASEA